MSFGLLFRKPMFLLFLRVIEGKVLDPNTGVARNRIELNDALL